MKRSLSSLLCQEHSGNLHSKKKRLATSQSSSTVDWWLHDLVLCCHFCYLVNINGFLAGRHMQLDVVLMVSAAKTLTWSIYHPAAQSWPHQRCPPIIITITDIVNKKYFSTLKAFRTGRTPPDSRCYGTDIPSELFQLLEQLLASQFPIVRVSQTRDAKPEVDRPVEAPPCSQSGRSVVFTAFLSRLSFTVQDLAPERHPGSSISWF